MRKAGDVCFAEVTRDRDGALVYTFLYAQLEWRTIF